MLIESGGVIIRMPASDINIYKRDTQGVILMRVEDGNQVIGVEKVDGQEEENDRAGENACRSVVRPFRSGIVPSAGSCKGSGGGIQPNDGIGEGEATENFEGSSWFDGAI